MTAERGRREGERILPLPTICMQTPDIDTYGSRFREDGWWQAGSANIYKYTIEEWHNSAYFDIN